MLNKKAIAAFAAGATLLSGLAVAAPALAENAKETKAPAAAADAKTPKAKLEEKVKNLKAAIEQDKKDVKTATDKQTSAQTDFDKAAQHVKNLEGAQALKQEAYDAAKTAFDEYTNSVKAADNAVTAYKDARTALEKYATAPVEAAEDPTTGKNTAADKAAEFWKVYQALEGKTFEAKDVKSVSDKTPEQVVAAANAAVATLRAAAKTANDDFKKVPAKAATDPSTTDKQGVLKDLNDAKQAVKDAKQADVYTKADKALKDAQKAVETAKAKQTADEASLKDAQELLKAFGETPAPKPPVTPPAPKPNPTPDPEPAKPGKVVAPKTKEELKAYVEQVKAALKAEKDAKKAEAVKKALEEFGKAAKSKDKAAFAAAMKKLLGLVPYTAAKKPEPKKSALEELLDPESVTTTTPFGTNTLFTNYKGLYVELLAHGLTNVRAYNVLLDKLEYGLHNGGWENIIKNFPEHDSAVENTCDFLASLRAQLRKAVKHYEHVQAAVKDIKVELKADYDEALAQHRWDDVKAIESKMAQAGSLYGVANSNRTRAVALLDSANDHAAELRCDTQAQDVRNAMDKEPNSPFKPAPAPKPAPKTPKAPKLPNTGAVVALAAVAASVLAGMGAALRKIRH